MKSSSNPSRIAAHHRDAALDRLGHLTRLVGVGTFAMAGLATVAVAALQPGHAKPTVKAGSGATASSTTTTSTPSSATSSPSSSSGAITPPTSAPVATTPPTTAAPVVSGGS